MATCSYSEFVRGCCGPSSGNPANIQCDTLGKCNKDVSGHLKSFKVRDSSVDTEASLLLARAGNFFLPVNILLGISFVVCFILNLTTVS